MLILDGVYIERGYGSLVRFQWVKAPTSDELAQLTHTIARRVGRFLERQGRTVSLWVRIRVARCSPCRHCRCCDPDDPWADTVGKTAGFSLHAGVAAKARERDKLERLCRYITRPAVSEKGLSLTAHGKVRYRLKTPYRDGTTHVIFHPLDFTALAHPALAALVRPCTSSQGWPPWCQSPAST